MEIKNKKEKIKNMDREDLLLTMFAEKNAGKHGGDGDMFAALAQEYKKERENTRKQKTQKKNGRVLWVSVAAAAAAVLITLAATLPFILRKPSEQPSPQPPSPPQYLVVDDLTVVPVTEAQLYKELGPDIIIPRPKGYALDRINLYYNADEVIKAYQYLYSSAGESETTDIEIYCVINNDFVFSIEKEIDDTGVNQFIPPFFVKIYTDSNDISLCRIIKHVKFIISLDKHDPVLLVALLTELTA